MGKILVAKDLHKTFYDPMTVEILKGVSLEASPGETIAITGASGEGKSTLLYILGTLDRPCHGTIEIMGQNIKKNRACYLRNKHIGFVFQGFHLLEDYTVIENVLMPSYIGRKKNDKAMELLEMVGLSQRAKFHAKLLSGGEKQRVAIARALCNDPEIILADEPAGNLDHNTTQNIYKLLINCAKEHGKTLITVTHDIEFTKLCDTTYLLEDGLLHNNS